MAEAPSETPKSAPGEAIKKLAEGVKKPAKAGLDVLKKAVKPPAKAGLEVLKKAVKKPAGMAKEGLAKLKGALPKKPGSAEK